MTAEATVSRTDQVYETIRSWILSLKIQPGSSFSETALAAELGTSKTPVREALVRLRRDGLVRVQSRSGYTVAPITFKDAQDICQLRTLLDGESARLAIDASADEIEVVFVNLASLDNSVPDPGERGLPDGNAVTVFTDWLLADIGLHRELAKLSGNARLVEALRQVLEQSVRLYHLRLTTKATTTELFHRHADLMSSIRSGDGTRAREAAAASGQQIQETLLEGVLHSASVQFANATPIAAKNTFYLDTPPPR
jgi:DNA-binding GntR family transcriptional regulator